MNRTSETEEQRKERLRIRRKKDKERRRTEGKKRSSEADDHNKQRLVGHGDGRRKKSKTGEGGTYQTAQVGHGDG